jgi:peptidoglycan-associated lipoprotein
MPNPAAPESSGYGPVLVDPCHPSLAPPNDQKTDVPARCLFNFAEGDRTLKYLSRIAVPVLLLVALIAVAGCKKKPKPLPPVEQAPPAAAPAPTAQLTATPASISAGDQVVLSWKTTDATSVSIDGIGDVPTSGVKSVTPSASTSYHLVARGEGGTADATARVTVEQKPAVAVPSTTMSEEEEFKANVHDIFYDYDSADVRADAQSTLSQDAAYLNSHPNIKVVIGGYCDERGSNEYNLALGQNRAEAARNALVNAGVAANRIRVISYGKEKPFCTESTEECWQQNRRAGFTIDR